MITTFMSGRYKLIETKNNVKILYLDRTAYVWLSIGRNWDILEVTNKEHKVYRTLSAGKYALYDVEDEPYLVDLQHLELEYGHQAWQGYLLPTGLPDNIKRRSRVIPTTELITGIPYFSKRMGYILPKVAIPHYATGLHAIGGHL